MDWADSDYHTASEFQDDFDSDNEPPTDKLAEKKMVFKGKDVRVYKRILQIGKRGFDRPAKYDQINFGLADVEADFEKIEQLGEVKLITHSQ